MTVTPGFWESVGLYLADHIKSTLAAIGFTGGGVGLIKFLKYVPAPLEDWRWTGAVFDTLQDMVSNHRVGERRKATGEIIPAAIPAAPPIGADPNQPGR